MISGGAALGLVVLLAAVVVQCYQFGQLPFTTIDGTYASSFIFFMGSTLGHLLLLEFSDLRHVEPGPAGQVRRWPLVPGPDDADLRRLDRHLHLRAGDRDGGLHLS